MKATCVEQVLYYAWLVRCGQYSSYFLTVYVTQAGLEHRTLPSASVFHVVGWQVYHSTQLESSSDFRSSTYDELVNNPGIAVLASENILMDLKLPQITPEATKAPATT